MKGLWVGAIVIALIFPLGVSTDGQPAPELKARPAATGETWPVGLEYKFSIHKDVDQATLERFAGRVREFSKLMWAATEGQMYIRKAIIQDNCTDGKVWVSTALNLYSPTRDIININEEVLLPTLSFTTPRTMLHEWGHFIAKAFYQRHGLQDEYADPAQRYEPCIMAHNRVAFCDDTNHHPSACTTQTCDGTKQIQSCWRILMDEFQGLQHPNVPARATPPDTDVTLIDTLPPTQPPGE